MIALVSGGCSGLGLSFTKYLSSLGYQVYALYNSSIDAARELEKNYDNVHTFKCDISNEVMVSNVLSKLDDIDIIINNAGIGKDNYYEDKTFDEFMSVVGVNLGGTFLMMKYGVSKLKKNGIIINISSNNAINAYNPVSMDYDASKAGINILTKDFSVVLDNLNKNQRVVSICPGWINTECIKEANPKYISDELERTKQERLLEPDDLVKYIIDNIEGFKNGEIREIKKIGR